MQKIQYAVIMTICLICIISTSITEGSSDKLVIYTVNYPLKYFAERIAGEHAEVVFPAPADVDPAYWMPDAKTIADYQKADFIIINGAHYAKWIEKVTLPQSKMINTSRKFRDRYIRLEKAVTHSHGSEGAHAHEDAAFTIWLDLELAAQQAREIEKALSRKKPELRNVFQENYVELERDLVALDSDIKDIVSKEQGRPLIASHPVYDYLARRYSLNIRSVHWEPDEIPGIEQWIELKEILKNHPSQWMLWESSPLNESVEKLESMGMKSMIFAPYGNVPEQGDFITLMKANVENLKNVFKGGK
jgi:zinc transport system substrate-binding protein